MNINKKLCLIIFFIFSFISSLFSQESVTVTSYYPSPAGIYRTLRLYPTDDINPASACSNAGEMYYDDSEDRIYICNGTSWLPLGGGYWRLSTDETKLYPINLNWNVGIGTNNPTTKFYVRGKDDTTSMVTFLPKPDGVPFQHYKLGVGIGTTTPNAELQVNGAISRQGTTLNGTAAQQATQINLGVDSITNNYYSTVGGGYNNQATGEGSTVGGGVNNIASGSYSTIGGGRSNTANGDYSTVVGGYHNTASGSYSTIGGGADNTASGNYSTVVGGDHNRASGAYSTVGGGAYNTASGAYSYVAGRRAKSCADTNGDGNCDVAHPGAFVWADSQDVNYFSQGNNTFNVRASGGIYFEAPAIYFNGGIVHQPADISEFMDAVPSEDIKEAEIVSLVGKDLLGKSQKPYNDNLIGVVSSKRTTTLHLGATGEGRLPIALAGRCFVKVSQEGGSINLGDPITSSSTPGMGMKANHSGKIIGYALEREDFRNKNTTEILVFVDTGYYFNPDEYVEKEKYQKSQEELEVLEKELYALDTRIKTASLK